MGYMRYGNFGHTTSGGINFIYGFLHISYTGYAIATLDAIHLDSNRVDLLMVGLYSVISIGAIYSVTGMNCLEFGWLYGPRYYFAT